MTTQKSPKEPSIKEIKDSLPSNLFHRSLTTSTLYLLRDLTFISIALIIGILSFPYLTTLPILLQIPLYCLYAFIQGTLMTGVWVVAHECGHQAFSDSQTINDGLGFVLHSLLLVPYYSWKESHAQHHRGTVSMERDTVWIPKTLKSSQVPKQTQYKEKNVFENIWITMEMVVVFLLGWPLHLLFNATGQQYKRWASHFDPESPIFAKRKDMGSKVILSDLGIACVMIGVYYLIRNEGFWFSLWIYIAPLLIVNFWLLLYTYLHHTDPSVPHYKGNSWSFVRGALSTIDRDYGIFSYFHHNIGDSHVIHHLFSNMPHYNAVKATRIFKEKFPELYKYDSTPIVTSLYDNWAKCAFVVDGKDDVLYYKHY